MKKVLIGLGVLVGVAAVAFFIYYNQQGVSLQFGVYFSGPWSMFGSQPSGQPAELPLWLVLFGTFVLGFLFSTVLGIGSAISSRWNLYKLKQSNKKLTKEVAHLRNIPLGEGPINTPPTKSEVDQASEEKVEKAKDAE